MNKKTFLFQENKNITYGLMSILIIYIIFLIVHNLMVISSPFPIEYREGHSMSSTTLMLEGIRPFTVETYPEYYNSYGIIYNILMIPFVHLFGNNLPIYRYINEVFFLLTLGMILFYKRPKRITWIGLVITCNMYLFYHINTNVSIRPDGLGTLLFISTILVAMRNHLSYKSLIVAGVLGMLAFFTKPYFILGWYFLSIVLLLKDWKKCLVANLFFHVFLVGGCIVVNSVFPLYFYETIFAYNDSFGSISYSLNQMFMAIKRISPIIFLAICGEIGKKQKKSEAIIFPVMVFSCCLILIYPLGTNDGAYLTYHTQLLMPLLAYWASENSNGKYLNSLCCQILVSLSLVYCVYKIPMISIPDDSGWKKIESYIRDGDSFYNSECVAPIILQQNKKIVNDGVSGFVYGFNKREITEALFHKDNILLDKKTSYINSLKDGCNQQRFSYLLLAHKVGETTSCQYEKNGYELIDDISLDLPCNWPIMVSVYKPTKDYRK